MTPRPRSTKVVGSGTDLTPGAAYAEIADAKQTPINSTEKSLFIFSPPS